MVTLWSALLIIKRDGLISDATSIRTNEGDGMGIVAYLSPCFHLTLCLMFRICRLHKCVLCNHAYHSGLRPFASPPRTFRASPPVCPASGDCRRREPRPSRPGRRRTGPRGEGPQTGSPAPGSRASEKGKGSLYSKLYMHGKNLQSSGVSLSDVRI